MKLILAEKPSVAKDFAKALGANYKDGVYKNSGYVITNCIGHLLTLYEPGDYDEKYKKWSLDALPIIPKEFSHKPIPDVKKQLTLIKKTIAAVKPDTIILATDAGREGELIGRLVLHYCGVTDFSKVLRFWSSEALTPDVISKGLANTKKSEDFEPLYRAGLYRQYADWLVGLNFTRAYTKKSGDLCSFGRVQTAVLRLIAERNEAVSNFTPVSYYQIKGEFEKDGGRFAALLRKDGHNRLDDKQDAEALSKKITAPGAARVAKIEKKSGKSNPPPLYNLTGLQKKANAKFGMTAKETLAAAQNLYEKHKCLSYPRTPSTVLGESNAGLAAEKIDLLSKTHVAYSQGVNKSLINPQNKRVFNDKKLEDHHALMPLAPPPEGLSDTEAKIFDLVVKSFFAVFHDPCEYENLTAALEASGEEFLVTGKTVLKKGWTAVLEEEKEDGADGEADDDLPELKEGESLNIEKCVLEEKKTKPPADFTESSILSAMERPGRFAAKEVDFPEGVGLGTQATRAAIIETLICRKYIERSKKKLLPTKKGTEFINIVKADTEIEKMTEVSQTAAWEMKLENDPESFYREIEILTAQATETIKKSTVKIPKEEIGKCPLCGAPVTESKKAYNCEGENCRLVIWKTIAGTKINPGEAKRLLTTKKSALLTFTAKNGNNFEAYLKLSEESARFEFEFGQKKVKSKTARKGKVKDL